jgi:hypothetical protein
LFDVGCLFVGSQTRRIGQLIGEPIGRPLASLLASSLALFTLRLNRSNYCTVRK